MSAICAGKRKGVEEITERTAQPGENAAAIVQDLLSLARRGLPIAELMNINRLAEQCLASPVQKEIFARHPDIHPRCPPIC